MKKYNWIVIYLFIFTGNLHAADTGSVEMDLSQIKEAERQIIIDELTYRLETKQNCDLVKEWTDKGSGAQLDGRFSLPSVADNNYIIGGFGAREKDKNNCVITVSLPTNNPADTPVLLVSPIEWKQIWNDKGSGADKDGSMWKAIPPDSAYRCIGSVPQKKYKKPDIPAYRCVHASLTKKIVTNELIWSSFGSYSDKPVTVLRLPNTRSFIAVPDNAQQAEAWDLKAEPVVRPDARRVDAILAERMARIESDLEARAKEKQAAQQAQAEAEAAAAEKQRLAEQAEKERLAREAEEKKQAEEEKQKQLATEATQEKQPKDTAPKQVAAVEEKDAPAVEPEKETPMEKPEPVKTTGKEPAKAETTTTASDTQVADSNRKSSGSSNSLYAFLVKLALIVIGLFVILSFILYKFIYRSKGSK